jgi:putative transposase
MEIVKRKVTYRLYPSRRQQNQMLETLRLHQKLYNAALEQRIDAYRRCGVSLNYNDQAHDLTQLRAEFPEYAALNAQSEQVTLKRLERAFKAFFSELKKARKSQAFRDSNPLTDTKAGDMLPTVMAGNSFQMRTL